MVEPSRLHALHQAFIDRSEQAQSSRREALRGLRTRMTLLEGESANLIKLVRLGTLAPDNSQIESELGNIAARKRALAVDIEMNERRLNDGDQNITPEVVAKLGTLIAGKLRDRTEPGRRDYVHLLVDRVEVGG